VNFTVNSPRLCSLVLVAVCALPAPALQAQFRAGAQEEQATGWPPPAVGVRVGFDNAQSSPMVGAALRIPVLPSGWVELLPNADITFLSGFKVYQVNFEAVYLTQARRGGFYVGGGVGVRNGIFSADPNGPRRSERTFSAVAGVRLGGLGRVRPDVEVRWIFQDEQARDPRVVAAGVSLALW
jgi:hypothetical protein